jgi:hypothetical protein
MRRILEKKKGNGGFFVNVYRNPSLGLTTKARACKVVGQERSPWVKFHAPESAKECEGMNHHTPKWIPCWELKSWWTPESSKWDCRGQNLLAWRVLYIIGNLLKLKCLKWVRIAYLDIWTHKLWSKKRPGIKLTRIDLIFWRAGDVRYTVGKLLMRVTTLFQTSSKLEVCTRSYVPPKSWESQLWEFRNSHLGVLG